MKWTELYHEIQAIKEIIGAAILVIAMLLVGGAIVIDEIRIRRRR
jgi:hypothetical protein